MKKKKEMMTLQDLMEIMSSKKSDLEKMMELEKKKGGTKVKHKVRIHFGDKEE
jgi:hypothetical protein